ncbi:BamA/TamA family outer membrane protein [Vibrio mediterranei]|uniref:BamA/TamA family outer membrane protein n=1 Tax=Vibrio mediterranei TaxID=689 RepID=UPI0012FD5D17|nr:BamA/TamA family outer membrane protein [Vibrio mediterranei]
MEIMTPSRMLPLALSIASLSVQASEAHNHDTQQKPVLEGRWLPAPQLSNGPKLGLSLGASLNYLKQFDTISPTSITGVSGTYSDTQSWVALLYNRSYWDSDQQRFTGVLGLAEINNDYDDYLGQGPASVTTNFHLYYLRYQHRWHQSDWFIGGSYVYTNINPQASDDVAYLIMTEYQISEEYNAGLGINITYDSRDNVMNPTTGGHLEFSSTAYQQAFGGDNNYWAFNTQYSYFQSLDKDWVVAYNTSLLSTPNAPEASKATLRRYRAYTPGENSADNAFVAQIETRYAFKLRWSVAGFIGGASLFDENQPIEERQNWYPIGGVGARYIMDVKSQALIRLDAALGKAGNHAIYLQLGQAF